jgi:hypothetical protein
MSQKKYPSKNNGKSGGKGNGRSSASEAPLFRLPSALFFWLPEASESQKWAAQFPLANDLTPTSRFIDPFHGDGTAWLYAGESFEKLCLNHPSPEQMSAFRLSTRRDPLVIQGVYEFLRLCGLTETWQLAHVNSWHVFHVEHFSHRVMDTPTLLSKLSVLFKVTLTSLLDAQAKEFSHQKQDFKRSCYAALIHGMKRCLTLSIKLGEPLPMETFQQEFRFAVFHGLFLYTKALYEAARAVGQFMDPHHTLMFAVHHALAKTDGTSPAVFHLFPDMRTIETQFKGFDSLVVQGVGRKTQFHHSDPLVFLTAMQPKFGDFVFSKTPDTFSAESFGELYDVAWRQDAHFSWHVTAEQAAAVNHLGRTDRLSDGRVLLSKKRDVEKVD